MKEHLHLFTPITSSRLHCLVNEIMIIRSEVKNDDLSTTIHVEMLEVKNGTIYYPWKWGNNVIHTHVLDLSKLTTKEQALNAIIEAVLFEVGGLPDEEIEDIKSHFIPKL